MLRAVLNRSAVVLLGAGAIVTGGASSLASAVAPAGTTATPAADCQPYGSTPCLLPFPDNRMTRTDRSTPTDRRLDLAADAMPQNTSGVKISPAEYDRNDGFSPGSALITHIAGLDNAQAFARTNPVGLLDMARSVRPRRPIVVIDEQTKQRQLIYAELDGNATTRRTPTC